MLKYVHFINLCKFYPVLNFIRAVPEVVLSLGWATGLFCQGNKIQSWAWGGGVIFKTLSRFGGLLNMVQVQGGGGEDSYFVAPHPEDNFYNPKIKSLGNNSSC